MDGVFSGWHWIIVAIVLVALFGAAKLPVFARSLGQSMRIFKSEVRGMKEDDAVATPPVVATPPAVAYQPVVQPPVLQQSAAPAAAAAPEQQYVIGADGQKYVLQPVTDQPQTGQH
jgi:sec-independent protein translocase protein TatA